MVVPERRPEAGVREEAVAAEFGCGGAKTADSGPAAAVAMTAALCSGALSTALEPGVAGDVDVEGASGGASAPELLEVATPSWPIFGSGGGMKGCEVAPTSDPAL